MAWNAARWKDFYGRERNDRAEAFARWLDDGARFPDLRPPLVFPHASLAACGAQVAAAALAAAASGAPRVLALGVLHGARAIDAPLVAVARAGDADARRALRRVHGPGAPGDADRWREEFSLDAFAALLPRAAARLGVPAPTLIARYPYLVGDDPASLPGIDELAAHIAGGACVVATADPVHHGHGYATPAAACRDGAEADAAARAAVEAQLALLARGDRAGFLARCAADASDFRDTGIVLAHLVGGRGAIVDLRRVDYADVLPAPAPTWVAAALIAWAR